ncbi:MAG: PD40 domain-containing protein [Ardenticatenia bacterium]|nr:PD40 domain-containing protein [Ardenticatenia bacterium]
MLPDLPTTDDPAGGRSRRPARSTCLYLGQTDDPGTAFLAPQAEHRCHATAPPSRIDLAHQEAHCFADCGSCARYIAPLLPHRRSAPRVLDAAAGQDGPLTAPAPALRTAADSAAGPDGAAGAASGRQPAGEKGDALRARLSALSFEAWVVAIVSVVLLAALIGTRLLRGDSADDASLAALPPSVAATITAAAGVPTVAPTTKPSATARATHKADDAVAAATAALPTPPAGGLVAALSPAERGVSSFAQGKRLPLFGDRNLRVGRYDGETYLGGILFPLTKIPKGSRVAYVALELAGLSDSQLSGEGEWTVELLDPPAADTWANLLFDTLDKAPATQLKTAWRLPAADLAPRRVNVLEFSPEALDIFIQRLPQGKVAFRLRGPAGSGDAENLFIWDTGYGEGFGLRPVLRVAFVPPPATATPARGGDGAAQLPPLPLVVWVSDPTPAPAAPTATPFPMGTYGLLKGMVLFYSDRFKPIEGRDNSGKPRPGLGNPERQLMVYDPASGRTGQVTQDWTYRLAEIMSTRGSDVRVGVRGEKCEGTCTVITIADKFGDARPLTHNGYTHYDPAISPDGEWIAFVSSGLGNDEIFKIHRGGGEEIRLTDNAWEWDKHPSFSPDGAQIVFYSNRDGRNQIYLMKPDGTEVRKLMDSPYNDSDPVWVR